MSSKHPVAPKPFGPKPTAKQEELINAVIANDEASLGALLALDVGVNFATERGTPAIAAAENGLTAILKLLLTHGADPNAEHVNGNTPLRAAILSGDGECVRLLLANG